MVPSTTNKDLPMICFISCIAFVYFSTFLEWRILTWTGSGNVTHYLDDRFFFREEWLSGVSISLYYLMELTSEMGVSIPEEKPKGPV